MTHMGNKVRNYKATTLGTTLVSTSRYEDVNWTTYLDPGTNYKTTVYVMETWEQLTNGCVERGTTWGRVEVRRPDGSKTGWCVALFGEELPERYDSKGAAQYAAEELVLA